MDGLRQVHTWAPSATARLDEYDDAPDDAEFAELDGLSKTTSRRIRRQAGLESNSGGRLAGVWSGPAATQGFSPEMAGAGVGRRSSNMDRSSLSTRTVPYGAVIHFKNYSVAPSAATTPWKAGPQRTSTGTGFYIGSQLILTNSHVIRNQTSLRLKRHGKPGNFAGKLLCNSTMCDLALVTVEDASFFEDVPAVDMQDAVPALDATVVVIGYPASSGEGAKSVTLTRGVVSNVQMLDLSLKSTNPTQLAVQIDAAINPGNSGGPVFNPATGECVGVAFAGPAKIALGARVI
jgi:S1-C subfamily serine protease